MITLDLAHALHGAGLQWQPADGDRFVVRDRDLDDQVFLISEMTVDVRSVPSGRLIAFNGTVEWALDSIMDTEAVWLPNESQLRELVAERFLSLTRVDGAWRCEVHVGGERVGFQDSEAAEAYGKALLHCLRTAAEVSAPRR